MVLAIIFSLWTAIALLLIIYLFSQIEWHQHFVSKRNQKVNAVFWFFTILWILIDCYVPFRYMGTTTVDHFLGLSCVSVFFIAVFTHFTFYPNSFTKESIHWASSMIYIGLPIYIAISFLVYNPIVNSKILLGFIIINWSNDVTAYLVGRSIGKHKLAPEISPKKTMEGFLGGGVGAIIAAFLINSLMLNSLFSPIVCSVLGVSLWLAGTAGDLFESRLKRNINIKDSGHLLPGHGGFLDRFDSFFFIIPIGVLVYLFHIIF